MMVSGDACGKIFVLHFTPLDSLTDCGIYGNS
jgi:hypothetical protein